MSVLQVLVVDDEAHIRAMLEDFCAVFGWSCRCVGDVPTALELVTAESFHVVILDWNLASESSQDVLARCIQLQPRPRIVLMTGAINLNAAQMHQMGVDQFLPKPFGLNDFRQIVTSGMESA